MKANEKELIRFLEASDTNFVIPVYQRNYNWKKEQCKQLYDDLVAMIKNEYKNHFFGTVVSIYNDSGRIREYLIIDGQQRTTTISILLLAIYNIIKKGDMTSCNIIKEKILNQYLINQYASEESKIKLKPIKVDSIAFERLFKGEEFIKESNFTLNYEYFYKRIMDEEVSIDDLYSAIERLIIVEIELKSGEDDLQLIFESLNSTGLDLTDADKVRNFILMGQSSEKQEILYNDYWNKVEKNTSYKVTQFIRDYMTMKENKITNISKVYFSFKNYINLKNINIESCLEDMLKFSKYYSSIINSNIGIKDIDVRLKRINKLEVTVVYPFFLSLFDDYYNNIINENELEEVLKLIETYVFRRIVCKIQTNALNKVFMNLHKEIKGVDGYKDNYVEALKYVLTTKKLSQRLPNDDEFKRFFLENDFYNMNSKNKLYLLERLENFNNREIVDVETLVSNNELSIEHIMPRTLTPSWKSSLGKNYNEVYNKYINTIGNLTLTGYNSKYSNKSFIEKRNMENGFKESRLRLNKYLGTIDCWNEENIIERAEKLYEIALNIWKYPEVTLKEKAKSDNLFSLGNRDDFTNTKVKKYIFLGDEIKVKNWADMYRNITVILYDIDPKPLLKLAKKNLGKISYKEEGIRTAFKIADNIYLELNLSTESKLEFLRNIFDEYNIDYNELLFNLE
ncbi:DUF262 domain-containing protein [Clostridium massiliamazoniense]|uniref:DUF262 domain-containing protein n=1 Tax=Clostridium massiliamazoniense TaxID=1347366 RepID=UPI0006D7A19F|nr:DUF262 domain-containing protein [Clostridium massiliamazoniense]